VLLCRWGQVQRHCTSTTAATTATAKCHEEAPDHASPGSNSSTWDSAFPTGRWRGDSWGARRWQPQLLLLWLPAGLLLLLLLSLLRLPWPLPLLLLLLSLPVLLLLLLWLLPWLLPQLLLRCPGP